MLVQRLLQDVVNSCQLAVVVVFPALWPLIMYVNLCEILEVCSMSDTLVPGRESGCKCLLQALELLTGIRKTVVGDLDS